MTHITVQSIDSQPYHLDVTVLHTGDNGSQPTGETRAGTSEQGTST